jgi:hypothetical protein
MLTMAVLLHCNYAALATPNDGGVAYKILVETRISRGGLDHILEG